MEREQRSSVALLNALMDRPQEAPLGPPEELVVAANDDLAALEREVDARRPRSTGPRGPSGAARPCSTAPGARPVSPS